MSVDLTHLLVDIENQKFNDCVGMAVSTYMEAAWKKASGESMEFSPAFIWWHAKEGKGNVGSSYASAFEYLKFYGICEEKFCPYENYVVDQKPSPEAYKNAKLYRITKYAAIYGIDEVKAWLDKGFPVAGDFKMPGMNSKHAMCIFGYDDTGFLIVNSWGQAWGEKGMFRMPYAEFQNRLVRGFVVEKFSLHFWATIKRKFKTLVSWYKLYR